MTKLNEPNTLWAVVDSLGKIEVAWSDPRDVAMAVFRDRGDVGAEAGASTATATIPVRVISEDAYQKMLKLLGTGGLA